MDVWRLVAQTALVLAVLGATSSAREVRQTRVQAGEARVWYLEHAGWAVETADHFLIFDYARTPPRASSGPLTLDEGWITPDVLTGRRVVVFVSHAHGDHYAPAVLQWASQVDDLTIVLGWPGPPGPKRLIVTDRELRRLSPSLSVSAVQHDFDGIPESAFLVQVDGLVIYHSGDHATLSDPPRAEFADNIDALARQVERVDLAFMSIFGAGAGRWVNAGDRYTIAKLRPRVVFPMHAGGREREYEAFATEARRLGLAPVFATATRPGQSFSYRNGRLDRQ